MHTPDGGGFLAGVEMDESGNFSGSKLKMDAFLELAD
jgi:hypothetical protein